MSPLIGNTIGVGDIEVVIDAVEAEDGLVVESIGDERRREEWGRLGQRC
jgi:hypothetical protein